MNGKQYVRILSIDMTFTRERLANVERFAAEIRASDPSHPDLAEIEGLVAHVRMELRRGKTADARNVLAVLESRCRDEGMKALVPFVKAGAKVKAGTERYNRARRLSKEPEWARMQEAANAHWRKNPAATKGAVWRHVRRELGLSDNQRRTFERRVKAPPKK